MIECRNLIKEFGQPPQRILHQLNFTVADGEFVAISGRSGSGKSTLLYIISTLDLPSGGDCLIEGKNLRDYNSEEIHRLRSEKVGFIFQFHHLLPELTAIENILLPARNLNLMKQKKSYAEEILGQLGIGNKGDKYPSQLSGGEQQRVAIARALIMDPKYIFADEPTGNLDTKNSKIAMQILRKMNQDHGATVCLVTHEPSFSAMADREIYLIDGHMAQRKDDNLEI